MEIPDELLASDLWTQVSDDQFNCAELNLKVIITSDDAFELRGIKDDDFILKSPIWSEISYKILEDTGNR